MYWCPNIVVFEEKNDYYDDDDYRLVTRNFNWHPNANCTLQLVKQICISQDGLKAFFSKKFPDRLYINGEFVPLGEST